MDGGPGEVGSGYEGGEVKRRGFLGGLLALGAGALGKYLPAPEQAPLSKVYRITKIDHETRTIMYEAANGLRGLVDDGTFSASIHGFSRSQRYPQL